MFCQKCGNQVSDEAVFCPKCGTRLEKAAVAPAVKVTAPVSLVDDEPTGATEGDDSRFHPLQFIRGIPFGFVFLAFLLPLFVISCSDLGTEIASFSAYETFDLGNTIAKLVEQAGNSFSDFDLGDAQDSLKQFSLACTALVALTVLAFGLSFVRKNLAAVFGIFALITLIALVVAISSKSPEAIAINPGAGFYVALVLYLTGVILCFVPIENEAVLPSAARGGIYLGTIAICLVFIAPSLWNAFSGAKAASNASEVGPAFGTYVNLQDAYGWEKESVGGFNEIGFTPPGRNGETEYFSYREPDWGVGMIARSKKNLGDCPKGSSWSIMARAGYDGKVYYTCKIDNPKCEALTPKFKNICQSR